MKSGAKTALVAVTVLVLALALHAEPIAQLHPGNYVNDFAGVLDQNTVAQLNDVCHQIDQKAHAQIAVVTIKTLDGADIVSYSVELYQKWGIGAKGKDRGVLILLAVQDHKYWTTVGYGLEAILPDGKVGGFGREAVPLLRQNDYNGAISLMTARVADVIAQDAGVQLTNNPQFQTRPEQQPETGLSIGKVIILIIVIIIVLATPLRSILFWMLLSGGRGGGGWGGGGFGGGGGGGGFGGFGGGSTGGGGAGGSW